MIVVVLNCFLNLCKANDADDPFTGDSIRTDTTGIKVPISIIKEANVKLHERLILKDIVMNLEEKERHYRTIIDMQDNKINSLSEEIDNYNNIINRLNNYNKTLGNVIGFETAILLVTIVCLICK